MNTTFLARIINERRYRGSPVLTTGEILNSMGPSGMQEALNKLWLVPDMETGFLMVNLNGAKLAEVAEACKCPSCHKPACNCEISEETAPAATSMSASMREAWAGLGVGRGSDNLVGGTTMAPRPAPISPTTPPASTPTAASTPASTPAPATATSATGYSIGTPVIVTDQNGTPAMGTVSSVRDGGRYRVNFDDKPPIDRDYSETELQRVDAK